MRIERFVPLPVPTAPPSVPLELRKWRDSFIFLESEKSLPPSPFIAKLKRVWQQIVGRLRNLINSYKAPFKAYNEERLTQIANSKKFIYFNDKSSSISAFLGNDYSSPLTLWNLHFKCAKAAFLAAKFNGSSVHMKTFCSLNAKEAQEYAEKMQHPRIDWALVRNGIMEEVLKAKFDQNPELKKLLLATKDAYLADHAPKDDFFEANNGKKTHNQVGRALMRIRESCGGIGIPSPIPKNYIEYLQNKKNQDKN